MAEQDQKFLEYIVKNIVDKPESVTINRTVDERGVLLQLEVDPEDMGKIIGKAGATAKAIRTLLRVLGAKHDARFNLKIVEPGGEETPEARQSAESTAEDIKEAETPAVSLEPAKEKETSETESKNISSRAREGLEDLDVEI